MLPLNLPSYPAKIQVRNGKNVIFDPLRKKYVALTPEEWVRQHFVHLLTDFKGYPVAYNEILYFQNHIVAGNLIEYGLRNFHVRSLIFYNHACIQLLAE